MTTDVYGTVAKYTGLHLTENAEAEGSTQALAVLRDRILEHGNLLLRLEKEIGRRLDRRHRFTESLRNVIESRAGDPIVVLSPSDADDGLSKLVSEFYSNINGITVLTSIYVIFGPVTSND